MAQEIIKHIHRVNAQRDLANKLNLMALIHQLQDWQCQRLLVSHDDLAQQQRYQKAMAFFVEELYGPKDFSQRDADLVRVIPKLAKVLPEKAMNAMNDALSLNALSFDLDMEIAQYLNKHFATQPINRDSYAQAYRSVGRKNDRESQITIISHLGDQLADVIKVRGIGMLISMSRRPAKMAGLLALHEFLDRGFNAFKAIGDVQSFIQPVLERETRLMEILLSENTTLPEDNPLPVV
ncbi:FFLEELY motif protein [Alteromonas genovensis]|uniref:FFLEELY motif protein n=1 Tax=Alteromonas genovensis TaxID=471225 RepID=UPI002FE07A4F